MRKLWHREISNRSRNQCDTARLGPHSMLLTCLNCSQLIKKLTLLLPIRVTFLWLFKKKCRALAVFVGNEWDSEAFIGSVPELEQSQHAQRSLFLWAPQGHRLPDAFFSSPLDCAGWVSGCGSIHQNKTKPPGPLTHQELMDLGTDKAVKLLHGDSMPSWGFLRFKLKLFENIKSGDSWLRYWTILWFPHNIWGVLHFQAEWLVAWKKRPPSFTHTLWLLSDRKD